MQTAIDFTGINFNGSDYVPERDNVRLSGHTALIFDFMKSGEWYKLKEISAKTGTPEASVSAILRHFRKERFGGHTVNKLHHGYGLYSYQLIVKKDGMF
jgi:hypothetical protein